MDAEYDALFEYNNALARFYWGTGTTLHHNNIYLSEGPLPACAQMRAVEHEKERTKARVLRDRPRPLDQPGWFDQVCSDGPDELNLKEPAATEMPRRLDPAAMEMPRKLEPTAELPAAADKTPAKLSPPPIKLPAALVPATDALTPKSPAIEFRREPMTQRETAPVAPPVVGSPVKLPLPPIKLPAALVPSIDAPLPPIPDAPAVVAPPVVELPLPPGAPLPQAPRGR